MGNGTRRGIVTGSAALSPVLLGTILLVDFVVRSPIGLPCGMLRRATISDWFAFWHAIGGLCVYYVVLRAIRENCDRLFWFMRTR